MEKRYFKRFAKRHVIGGSNNYLELFQKIEQNEFTNEDELTQSSNKSSYISYFPVAKTQLLEQLLNALHQLKQNSSIDEMLKKSIHQCAIILNKGFHKASFQRIKKIKKKILHYERFCLLPELLLIEKQWMASQNYKSGPVDDLLRIYQEEKECLAQIQLENEYWLLFSRIYQFHFKQLRSRREKDIKIWKEFYKNELLIDIANARTSFCRLNFFQLHALFYFVEGNAKKAAAYNQLFIKEFNDQPQLFDVFPERFLSTFNNYLIDRFQLGDYQVLKEGLNQLYHLSEHKAFKKIDRLEFQIFKLGAQLELNLGLAEGHYKENVSLIPTLSKEMIKYRDQLNPQQVVTFYYLFAYSFFEFQDYKNCLTWTNRLIDETSEDHLEELQGAVRLLHLMAHYELGHDDLLDYEIVNIRRYHGRRKRLFKMEKLFLSALQRAIGKLLKDRAAIFKKLYQELEVLSGNPVEKSPFSNFDYLKWLKTKY